jgi:hypothetical protein
MSFAIARRSPRADGSRFHRRVRACAVERYPRALRRRRLMTAPSATASAASAKPRGLVPPPGVLHPHAPFPVICSGAASGPASAPVSRPASGIGRLSHMWLVRSHCCVAVQSVSVRHPTQTCVASLHTGVAPVHAASFAAVHCTHVPALGPLVAHAGVAPPQSVARLGSQPRHMLVVGSHDGVDDGQSVFVRQPTQRFIAMSHVVIGPQFESIVHATH